MEDGRLGGVEVFRLTRAQDASAETEYPAAAVLNGKHHTITKAIISAPAIVAGQQAGLAEQVGAVTYAQRPGEAIPPVRCEAQMEARRGLAIQATALQVLGCSGGTWVMSKLFAIERTGRGQYFVQCRERRSRFVCLCGFLGQCHAGALREIRHCLAKIEPVDGHQKADHRAVCAAAEAVIELLLRADGERRGLFLVEWAAASQFTATAPQRHARADDLGNVGACQDGVDEVFGYPAAHVAHDSAGAPAGEVGIPATAATGMCRRLFRWGRRCSAVRRWYPSPRGGT